VHDGAHVAPPLTLPTAPPPRPQVVHVYNDAHAALEYYAEGRPGCVLVAGTGARAGPARAF
jgi:N-acetylglucosamine kinase-like BadF-type ATPase